MTFLTSLRPLRNNDRTVGICPNCRWDTVCNGKEKDSLSSQKVQSEQRKLKSKSKGQEIVSIFWVVSCRYQEHFRVSLWKPLWEMYDAGLTLSKVWTATESALLLVSMTTELHNIAHLISFQSMQLQLQVEEATENMHRWSGEYWKGLLSETWQIPYNQKRLSIFLLSLRLLGVFLLPLDGHFSTQSSYFSWFCCQDAHEIKGQ